VVLLGYIYSLNTLRLTYCFEFLGAPLIFN
jgi:hypothetical protein